MMILMLLVSWFLISGALIFLYSRREMRAVWQEPVLRRPVLIIESDDWGAGPPAQAQHIREIAGLLEAYSDCEGRHPVMTLGMVLAIADGKKTLSSGSYHRQIISMSTHGPLLDAINHGVNAGVFSLQLHAMEHYWPSALLAASKRDKSVAAWLVCAQGSSTEDLPAPLQSRWIDASVLPARALQPESVQHSVREEVDTFKKVFGVPPSVVVPPTFIWNDDVENAWADAGVRVIVTPGNRFETRDENGCPSGRSAPIHNGQTGEKGIVYLVRDVYFEPSFGHTAMQAADALILKTRMGRPALFETHRFNFVGMQEKRSQALGEIGRLFQWALKEYPGLAFLSSAELATILKNHDQNWLEQSFRRRFHIWMARVEMLPRLRKLAWVTGWIVPAGLLWKLTA